MSNALQCKSIYCLFAFIMYSKFPAEVAIRAIKLQRNCVVFLENEDIIRAAKAKLATAMQRIRSTDPTTNGLQDSDDLLSSVYSFSESE